MTARLAALLLGLAGLAAAASAQPPEDRGNCLEIILTGLERPLGAPETPRVSAAATVDLELAVLLSPRAARAEDLLVQLSFLTPRGYLYRTRDLPISPPEVEPRARRLRGYPRPVAERPAREVLRGGCRWLEVQASLPIAGTQIVRSGLYGEWRVAAKVADLAPPCSGSLSFVLEE